VVSDPSVSPVEVAEALVAAAAATCLCNGVLVVHQDGAPALCSEELDGRPCTGIEEPHQRSISCADLFGVGGCEVCASAAPDEDRLVGHAVRVAVAAARRTRCCRHRRARGGGRPG